MDLRLFAETQNVSVHVVKGGPGFTNQTRAWVVVKDCAAKLRHIYKQRGEQRSDALILMYSSFDPTFRDLHAIIQCITEIEVEKYRERGVDGRDMIADFLRDAVFEPDYSKLEEYYSIPGSRGQSKNVSPWEVQPPSWLDLRKGLHDKIS